MVGAQTVVRKATGPTGAVDELAFGSPAASSEAMSADRVPALATARAECIPTATLQCAAKHG
jgi:hypothetical protein